MLSFATSTPKCGGLEQLPGHKKLRSKVTSSLFKVRRFNSEKVSIPSLNTKTVISHKSKTNKTKTDLQKLNLWFSERRRVRLWVKSVNGIKRYKLLVIK